MTTNRSRRDRVARLGELAADQEEQARSRFRQASELVDQTNRRREQALEGAAELARQEIPLALRGHLTGVGARHLVDLADEKAELVDDADQRRAELAEAATRTRSLERLVGRLDRERAERQARQDRAELQDLVAIRAVRGERPDTGGPR